MTTKAARGRPPSFNRILSKKKRRDVIVAASMDVYRVENARHQALEQLARFKEMSEGSDGGLNKPGHDGSIREMHFSNWKDSDFKTLYSVLFKAIKAFNKENNIDMENKGQSVDND